MLGGVVSGVVLFFLNWVYTEVTKLPLPLPVPVILLVGLALAALVASLVSKTWRRRFWSIAIGGFFRRHHIIVTTAGRERRRLRRMVRRVAESTRRYGDAHARVEGFNAGVEARSLEVADERRKAAERYPDFRVEQKGDSWGENVYFLVNSGWPARDVKVHAPDPDLFVLDSGEGNFKGLYDGGDKWFTGEISERGKAEGVDFPVSWIDSAGDEIKATAPYNPAASRGASESAREAHRRGYQEAMSDVEASRAKPKRPPLWYVKRVEEDTFILGNGSKDTVATNINLIVEDGRLFSITSPPEQDVLLGSAETTFKGQSTVAGRKEGIWFLIEWSTVDGDPQQPGRAFLDGWTPALGPFVV